VSDYLDETAIRQKVLPRTKAVAAQNARDSKMILAVLCCIDKVLERLDRQLIEEFVLPLLLELRTTDADIMCKVVCKYILVMALYLFRYSACF